jgi:transcriptional regulator with XRE-family HTH domain
MDNLKVLSRRVKMIRLAQGVSQTKMAEVIGTSQTNLSNMEAGRTAITIQNLFKIQKVLGCKMADFFVDFDGEAEEASDKNKESIQKSSLELEDALNILKLLKAVDVKGL